ncbi:heavy metal-responsive transcriptional regulator [Pimelobacter simplex]|uniref:heavy metal-responsive transcriptional regulator n=1 Tax=Nocardioides simplex TaxID=2045 RepID=UPI0019344A98|nr:heavy metal-responsive transcriptional regulator [Pimelobacter simplex]
MNIAELAERAGVKVSTLRFYERRGVLPAPPRTSSGYRDFDEEDVVRVRYLRRGQQLGFTLAELGELTALTGSRVVIAGEVASRGREKLAEIDARIADLAQLRDALAGLLALQCTDPDEPCPIISALGTETGLELPAAAAAH